MKLEFADSLREPLSGRASAAPKKKPSLPKGDKGKLEMSPYGDTLTRRHPQLCNFIVGTA
jgi:hypothetical protein